jgi:hypothetical protein
MPHQQPSDLVIVVYLEASASSGGAIKAEIKTLPEEAIVEHAGQRVHWIGIGGEISSIRFENSNGVPGPPDMNDRKRSHKTKLPPATSSASGTRKHKYGFKFHPDGGGEIEVDPYIIIEY